MEELSSRKVGKKVFKTTYFHRDALGLVQPELKALVERSLTIAGEGARSANVYKVDEQQRAVSLLNYPRFFDEPFPMLGDSWRVYLDQERVVYRTYADSLNPPILHRKELLLPPDHPRFDEYALLTAQAEQLGLFSQPSSIGFQRHWEQRIRQAGYRLEEHCFQPLGNDVSLDEQASSWSGKVERHRTALSRQGLSAPMQALARHGLIRDDWKYFDYGCGRGDDLAALREAGMQASGWDPYYAPENSRTAAEVVNLGFVLNVIEDVEERIDALVRAYGLAQQLLVVSVMLYTNATPVGKRYRDGYLTQRNTFQKYYTQQEFKEFLENVLDTDAIPVGPGIMYVFKEKQAEQKFLLARQRNHHSLRLLGYRKQREAVVRQPRGARDKSLSQDQLALLQEIWGECLELGRLVEVEETLYLPQAVLGFGNWRKTLKQLEQHHDVADLEPIARSHREDILVYLALQQFARRQAYRSLDTSLQFDIKHFLGDYQKAQALARDLLYSIARPELVEAACQQAAEKGLGFYTPGESLQVHVSLVEQLPALLRVYVGCGVVLYGDLDGVDLVKVHTQSTKVTLLKFAHFEDTPLPRLVERIKITLRSQEVDFFLYGGEFPPPLLFFKTRYINEECSGFAEQKAFDEALQATKWFQLGDDGYGPSEREFVKLLRRHRREVMGFELVWTKRIPELDEPCGDNFRFRDFVECGETQARLGIPNVPKQAETYNALYQLAVNVLDPVIDYFGAIKLTYGFASPELTKHIKRRIAPKLDQHAGHELNRLGKLVCERGGVACDFIVEDEDMEGVVKWINSYCEFDRLYYYSSSSPIHVSYGLHNSRAVFEVVRRPGMKSYPLRKPIGGPSHV